MAIAQDLALLKRPLHGLLKAAYKVIGESTEIPVARYQDNVTMSIYLLQIMSGFQI